jgi:hypothetical protein
MMFALVVGGRWAKVKPEVEPYKLKETKRRNQTGRGRKRK